MTAGERPDPTDDQIRRVLGPLDWPYGPNIDPQARRHLIAWALDHQYRLAVPRRHCLHWPARQQRRCAALQDALHDGNIDVVDLHTALDHPTFWKGPDGQPALLLAQPYHLDHTVLDRIADTWPLDVTVTEHAPWYGHGTHGVYIRPARNVTTAPAAS